MFWVWLGEGLATPGPYDREMITQPCCEVRLHNIAPFERAPITLISTAVQNDNKIRRLNAHINSSHISNDYQSAYRKFHSTETALLKIHNDIFSSMDDGRVTALTLFDLSAAFDPIDHNILLRRLGDWCGGGVGRHWRCIFPFHQATLLQP